MADSELQPNFFHRLLGWIKLAFVSLLIAGAAAGGWWVGDWQGDKQASADAQTIATLTQQLDAANGQLSQANKKIIGYQDYLATNAPADIDPKYLQGYSLPVDQQPPYDVPAAMPSAERAYRGGIHEGMDFPVIHGTPVVAVGDGRVIRVDSNYHEPPLAYLESLSQLTEQLQFTPPDILDTFRGRQVWLLLPGGVIVRYCHLESIADITLGQQVKRGTVLAKSGSSGTLDGAQHLHFEIRVGNTFLGSSDSYQAMVAKVKTFFNGQ